MVSRLDEHLTVAIRAATHHKLSYFYGALLRHKDHETFQVHDWPFSREIGFTCRCSGVDREWRINISTLRESLPDARAAFMRFRSAKVRHGNKARKRERRRADTRAKALLHRSLTKEQRWDLRASKSFEITGKDGRVYRITEGSCNNVKLLEGEKPRYSLCIIPSKEWIPMYDLMLAQKVLLEADPETFLRTAQATDLNTRAVFPNAGFIADGVDPLPNEVTDEAHELVPLPDEVLDNPGPWVAEQLAEARHEQT